MKKVIFDVDGVLISEERYIDAGSLTIWEWLYGNNYMGLPTEQQLFDPSNVSPGELSAIRVAVWGDDRLMHWLESRGIDGIWKEIHVNLISILWLMAEVYKERSGEKLHVEFHNEADIKKAGLLFMGLPIPSAGDVLKKWESIAGDLEKDDFINHLIEEMKSSFDDVSFAEVGSEFWNMHVRAFSDWFEGDDVYIETMHQMPYSPGKEGFLSRETPLVPLAGMNEMMERLKEKGYSLGVATLRNRPEVRIPFHVFHWDEILDSHYIATVTDVEKAVRMGVKGNLYKPHPFLYECAAWGRDREKYNAYALGLYKAGEKDEIWVIGDTMGDYKGAMGIGARFIGIADSNSKSGGKNPFEGLNVPVVSNVLEAAHLIMGEE